MNRIRFVFATLCAAVLLSPSLQAQTIDQQLTFSMLGEYQTNILRADVNGKQTYQALAPTALLASANIVKAIAIDMEGPNWPKWAGATLVREINLVNSNESIFLRKNGLQTNVSQYFVGFENNFTAGLTNLFPSVTNFIPATNYDFVTGLPESNSFSPPIEVDHGYVFDYPTSNTYQYGGGFGIHSLSFHTTNIQFNLIGTSFGLYTNVIGRVDGTTYQYKVKAETITWTGIFELNTDTNILTAADGTSTNSPFFVGGPIHGFLFVSPPNFSALPVP